MNYKEMGYKIENQAKVSVSTSEDSYTINNQTVYFQNTGTATIYIDSKTGVDNTKFEIYSGTTSGPWLFTDKVYFVGAATSSLKILFVNA